MMKGTPRSRNLAPARSNASTGTPAKAPDSYQPPATLPEPAEPAYGALALEAAQYIAQMSAELATIARASNLDLLAYFLEMARVEAASSVRELEGSPD